MYTNEDLNSAVKVGIFDEHSVEAFRAHIAKSRNTVLVDEEDFRLLSGFNDIFVAIASLLLLGSAGWLGGQISESLGFLISAIISWFLSLYFVINKKLALPAIVFLFTFVVSVGGSVFWQSMAFGYGDKISITLAAGIGVIASWIHWRKFRVPITVALGVACLSGFFITFFTAQILVLKDYVLLFVLASGLISFLIAMYWDSRDRARNTRSSDIAFWLHLLSAPLVVHPVFSLIGIMEPGVGVIEVFSVILLYVFLGLVSVVIDRRALMVSSLVYVLYALTALFKSYGVVGFSFAVSGVCIGFVLLLLSAFWQKVRRFLLGFMPESMTGVLPLLK
jgi:hypothetical protein